MTCTEAKITVIKTNEWKPFVAPADNVDALRASQKWIKIYESSTTSVVKILKFLE